MKFLLTITTDNDCDLIINEVKYLASEHHNIDVVVCGDDLETIKIKMISFLQGVIVDTSWGHHKDMTEVIRRTIQWLSYSTSETYFYVGGNRNIEISEYVEPIII